jgi:hypothetical protein|tara:strand:- start:88 stop:1170 length:1083 start_codon:yes stop_codon:yes gene_type:complete
MYVFKPINVSDFSLAETKVHKLQSLDSASLGISATQYRSGSKEPGSAVLADASGSYWQSLHALYYSSGSSISAGETLLNQPAASLANYRVANNQHINKFYATGSVLSIPQQYFGEKIKPGSVKITDSHNDTLDVILKDDGFGNLYSSNAKFSQSVSSPSSSDNYAGNIFYDSGIIAVTETGSTHQEAFRVTNEDGELVTVEKTVARENGANLTVDTATVDNNGTPINLAPFINLKDVLTDGYTCEFKSTQTLFTQEYIIRIEPQEYNRTLNHTARGFLSGSSTVNHTETPYMGPNFTGSSWTPYLTQIHLFSDKTEVLGSYDTKTNRMIPLVEPIIIANLPRPIRMRTDMAMTFKIRLDV